MGQLNWKGTRYIAFRILEIRVGDCNEVANFVNATSKFANERVGENKWTFLEDDWDRKPNTELWWRYLQSKIISRNTCIVQDQGTHEKQDLVQAKGKGSIIVQTKMEPKFLQDVLLVPYLKQYLLSIGKFL